MDMNFRKHHGWVFRSGGRKREDERIGCVKSFKRIRVWEIRGILGGFVVADIN